MRVLVSSTVLRPPYRTKFRVFSGEAVFELRGFANDQLLLARGYVRPLADHAQVVCCEVCGTPFVEGLPEHMAGRHGGGGREVA